MTLIYLLAVIGATPQLDVNKADVEMALAANVKKETHATEAKPLGNPGEWAEQNDYPISALRQDRHGTVSFQLSIDKNGMVEKCEVTVSSGHADLDAVTCKVVSERARFSPALDARGNAKQGQYSGRIRWQIPDLEDPNFDYSIPKAANTTFSIVISENGEVTNCKVKSTDPETEKNVCSDKRIFTPYVDAEGNTKRVQLIVSTVIKVIELDSLPAQENPDAPNK